MKSDYPAPPTPLVWSPVTHNGGALVHGTAVTSPTSAAWPTANRAYYYPMMLSDVMVATHYFAQIGTTGSTGNIDMAIYNEFYERIHSAGSTAVTTANTRQKITISNLVLAPGRYYAAIAFDSGTPHLFRVTPTLAQCQQAGIFQQATAFPLPANFTRTKLTGGYIGMFGVAFAPRT